MNLVECYTAPAEILTPLSLNGPNFEKFGISYQKVTFLLTLDPRKYSRLLRHVMKHANLVKCCA
jgi:hypothetical protein